MAIGPVQLLVLGFSHPDFRGEVVEELERLRENDTVRVIDALAVAKDADGNVDAMRLSNLTADEAVEFGSKVGALLGLGLDGEAGLEEGARLGAEQAAADGGVRVFAAGDAWDVLAEYRTTRPRHWSSSSTTGRCRCATRSCAPAASASATASSARSTSSPSGWSPRSRRNSCSRSSVPPRQCPEPSS